MKKIFFTILIFSLFIANGTVLAGEPPAAQADRQANGGDLELVARFDFTNPLSLAASDSLAFVGVRVNQGNQVAILDTLDPAHPVEVASIDLQANDFNLLGAIGDMLYISVRGEGIRIYDISAPAAPQLVKSFYPIEYLFPWQMVVSGDLAYLADYYGLVILDISDPVDPALVGYENNGSSLDTLYIQGHYVYALGGGALRSYDVANPAQPVLLDEYYVDPSRLSPRTLAVYGDHAYLSSLELTSVLPENYAELIDLSDPANLRKLHDLPELAAPNNQLVVSGDMLYAVRSDGLALFSLADPGQPQPLGRYPGYQGLVVQPQSARTVYLDQEAGLQLLDTADPSNPRLLGFYDWPQNATNLEVEGASLYSVRTVYTNYPLFEVQSLLQVVDISDPHHPLVSGAAIVDGFIAGKVFVSAGMVYLPADFGLAIVDATDPHSLQTATLWLNGSTSNVAVFGDVAYTLTYRWGSGNDQGALSFIDVSDPLAPSLLGEFIIDEYVKDLSVEQQGGTTMAYIVTASGWLAVDVSDPAQPQVVFQHTSTPEIQRIATETRGAQTIAYLAKSVSNQYNDPNEGLAAMDVSDPAQPIYIGIYSMETGSPTVLIVEDSLVYYAEQYGGDLKLMDFNEPSHPALVGLATLDGASMADASLTPDNIIAASEFGDVLFYARTSHLDGYVTDHNSQPYPGVSLALSRGDTTLSDDQGSYAFSDLVFGSYLITPTLPGYTFAPAYRQVSLPHDSHSQNFVILAAPVSSGLQPGMASTLVYTDVQGLPTSFVFPAGLVTDAATATVTPTLATGFFGMRFAGHAFELDIQGVSSELTYPQPVTVTIQYSLLDTAGITDTNGLTLYRWQDGSWLEASASCPPGAALPNNDPGVFQAVICQDGRYALLGPTRSLALPIVPSG